MSELENVIPIVMPDGTEVRYVLERTCKYVHDIGVTAYDEDGYEIENDEAADEADMSCNYCGYLMLRGDIGWFDEEPGECGGWICKPRFNYCPHCGAKVVR